MKTLNINIKEENYNIIINNEFFDMAKYIKEVYQNEKVFIITDENVKKYQLERVVDNLNKEFKVEVITIKAGEEYKSIDTYQYVTKELINKNIRRNELIIALGGGVIGDLSAFVASTIYRGVNFINIPTTLLSMVDSSIGGKTGIDYEGAKNVLGTFYQPKLVLICLDFLKTLPNEEFISGMGELIKHGMIGNKELLFDLKNDSKITEDIIYKSLSVKKKVVELDPFDQKERMFLNFGHTFGHVIELKYNYKHGVAVAIGMLMALKLGIDLNISKYSDYDLLNDLLVKYNFQVNSYDYHVYLKNIKSDKKNLAGIINFILLEEIEKPILYKIKEDKVEEI